MASQLASPRARAGGRAIEGPATEWDAARERFRSTLPGAALYTALFLVMISNGVRDGTLALAPKLVVDALATLGLFRQSGLFWVPNRILRIYAVFCITTAALLVALGALADGLGEDGLVPVLSSALLAAGIALGLLYPPVSRARQLAAAGVWAIGFLHGYFRHPILP